MGQDPGEDAEDLVAVDDASRRVDRDEAVGVAVEGEAEVRAPLQDGRRKRCRIVGRRRIPGVTSESGLRSRSLFRRGPERKKLHTFC